jgi:NAD(P)H-flavin reductase
MAILRHRAAVRAAVPATLLYSSRVYDDIIYRIELDRIMANESTVRIVYTLTRTQPEGWTGYRRCIDRDILTEVAPRAEDRFQAAGACRCALRSSQEATPWS